MSIFFKTALQFILAQKARNFFITLGLSLGILLIVAGQIIMTSIEHSHETWIKETYGEYDMTVGHNPGTFLSAEQIREIESYPHASDSTPYLYPYFGLHEEYPEMGTLYPWYVGVKDVPLARGVQYNLLPEGVFPKPGEVVISNHYAQLHDIKIGDTITLPFPPYEDQEVKVIAITEEEVVVRNLAVFDLEWLREATGLEGQASRVLVQLESPHIKEAAVAHFLAMSADFDIDTRDDIDELRENISGLLPIIQGLNVAIFIVSALIIISTMQLSVQEKQRELATLRLVGAGRKQVFSLVLVEALIVGVVATLLGALLGLIVPQFSLEFIGDFMNVQMTEMVYPWLSIALFTLGFFGIILLASMVPAYQASMLPPLVAYQQATHVYTQSRMYSLFYGCLVFVTVVLSLLSLFVFDHLAWHVSAAIAILLSLFVGIPVFVAGFTALISWLSGCLRLPLEYMLAARNTLRQMKRSVQIATIFMLGVTVAIVGITILNMVKQETLQYVREEIPTEIRIHVPSETGGGVSTALFEEINALDGVKAFYYTKISFLDTRNLPNREGATHVVNDEPQTHLNLAGIDFQLADALEPIRVLEGSLSPDELGDNGVAIHKDVAERTGYGYGDTIKVNVLEEGEVTSDEWSGEAFVIKAVIDTQPLFSDAPVLLTTPEIMEKQLGITEHEKIQINAADGYSSEELLATIKQIAAQPEYASKVFVMDQLSLINEVNEQINQRMFILFIAVGLMLVLSCIGLMNSSASSIRERIQELAMLRAIGCSKRKLFIVLLCEGAFLLGVCGMLGVGFATWATYHFAVGLDASAFILSVPMVIGFVLAIPLVGALAVLSPARWATKQEVIEHIH